MDWDSFTVGLIVGIFVTVVLFVAGILAARDY